MGKENVAAGRGIKAEMTERSNLLPAYAKDRDQLEGTRIVQVSHRVSVWIDHISGYEEM